MGWSAANHWPVVIPATTVIPPIALKVCFIQNTRARLKATASITYQLAFLLVNHDENSVMFWYNNRFWLCRNEDYTETDQTHYSVIIQ